MKNYYEILEVSPKSSKEIIEKAYKVLSEKYYPKSYKGADKLFAQEKFLEINEAYKILSDTFLREQYDTELNKQIAEEQIENYRQIQPFYTIEDIMNIQGIGEKKYLIYRDYLCL